MLRHLLSQLRGRSARAGYSLIELVITVGMILIVTTFAMPSFISYYQSARVRAAAQTVSAYLNEGRQLAIKTNGSVCVSYTTSTMQFRTTNCSGSLISVAGLTNSSNSVRLPDGISLTANTSAIFGQLGNATTAAQYTVTDTASNRTLTITVAGSGRITIP
jgi:type IV fimbrial biogenesis protein FimT